MEAMARQGAWEAVRAMEREVGRGYGVRVGEGDAGDAERVRRTMQGIVQDLQAGEVDSALE